MSDHDEEAGFHRVGRSGDEAISRLETHQIPVLRGDVCGSVATSIA